MLKITETDIRMGMVVNTPDGPGPIENFDRRENTVGVAVKHDIRNLKAFKLDQLSLLDGQLPPSIIQEVGDIAVIFSRIEDRIQDFLNFVFDLKNTKQRIMLIKGFSTTQGLETINDLIKDCYSQEHESLKKWKSINERLRKFVSIRNNIIHGSMYYFDEKAIFSNSKKISSIKINPETQAFNYAQLMDISQQLYNMYYENMRFLNSICVEVKAHINKLDERV